MTQELLNRKKVTPSTLDALDRLQKMLPEYRVKPSLGMQYGQENKYVTWRFDTKDYPTKIELLHITDVQYGHVECQVERVKEYRDWVLASPNRFVLFGGDMVDAATVFSPGQPWENVCAPHGQVYQFCELWAPARHRILGYVGGNHERRGLKTYGDLGLLIAYLLKIPYSSGQQLIDIHYGAHKPYKVHLWHGSGASKTKGAKAMMVKHFVDRYPGSHLYLVGHLHDCVILPEITWERSHERNKVKMIKRVSAMSSSFLNFWGTYAEVMGLSANDVLMGRAILEATGKWEFTIR